MNFTLIRRDFRPDGIFGELQDDNGIFYCMILEHAYAASAVIYPSKESNAYSVSTHLPKIPPGEYKCTRFKSPHLGYEVFILNDVPGHNHCLIHIGNYNEDSDGCVLLGSQIGNRLGNGKMITSSEQTFKRFMETQKYVDSFMLTVI